MIVLRVDKQREEIEVMEEGVKKTIKLPKTEIKKIMRWDKIKVEEGRVVVEKRAKPISIDKLILLRNYVEEGIRTTIYGVIKKGYLTGKNGKIKVNLIKKEGEVIIENAIIKKDMVLVDKKSRVFELRE